MFEDIDLDVSGVVSALSKDDSNNTSQDEAKWPRRKRLSVYACLMLALLVLIATIVVAAVPFSTNESGESAGNSNGGNIRGTVDYIKPSKKMTRSSQDGSGNSTVSSGSSLPSVSTQAATSPATTQATTATASNVAATSEPFMEHYYPDVHSTTSSCICDGNPEPFVLIERNRPMYLFGTEEECCEAWECEDVTIESTTTSSTNELKSPKTSSTVSLTELLMESTTTSPTELPVSRTTSSTISPKAEQKSNNNEIICVPTITLQQNLLSDIKECNRCSSQVTLDGDTAVVRYDNDVYFFSNEGGDWEKSPNVYRGTSSDLGLALSGNVTVVSDFTADDLHRNVFVIENDLDDKGRKVRIIDWNSAVFDEIGYGHSIDIYGDLMVIGTPEEDGGGAAYVCHLMDDDWHLETVLPLNNSDSVDDFAECVAVMDDRVAVTGFNAKGHMAVFVYNRKNPSSKYWDKMEEIVVDHCDDDCDDDIGLSLAFTDAGGLMIGYPRKESLYYFVLGVEGLLGLGQEVSLPTGYLSDQVLSVSGNVMVVGGVSDLLVFVQAESMWKEVAKLLYTGKLSRNVKSISLSGRNLMISSGNHVL